MASEELSERELKVLEHLEKARELEVTIAEYARGFDVDAGELYQIRQKLLRKGAIAGARRAVKDDPPGEFMRRRVPRCVASVTRADWRSSAPSSPPPRG